MDYPATNTNIEGGYLGEEKRCLVKLYLSKLHNLFVKIAKYICLNYKMYLSKFQNVFINFMKGRRRLLGKNLSAKGVWPH